MCYYPPPPQHTELLFFSNHEGGGTWQMDYIIRSDPATDFTQVTENSETKHKIQK